MRTEEVAQGMWLGESGGGQSLRVPCERIGRTEAMARGEEPWGQDQGSWLWFCGTGPAAGIPTIVGVRKVPLAGLYLLQPSKYCT